MIAGFGRFNWLTVMLVIFIPEAIRVEASQPNIPNEIHITTSQLDEFGKKIEAELRPRVTAKVDELRKGGVLLWGLTGDYKPSFELQYLGHRRDFFVWPEDRAPSIIFRYRIKVRVKLDALGGIFTTKVAAVESEQVIDVAMVPVVDDCRLSIEPKLKIVSATARKERQAKQKDADALRDGISAAVRDGFKENVMKHKFVPDNVAQYNVVRRISISGDGLHIIICQPGRAWAEMK